MEKELGMLNQNGLMNNNLNYWW